MTDERGRSGRIFTHAELDEQVHPLHSVGGLYELIAQCVERQERPRCVGPATDVCPPWYRA